MNKKRKGFRRGKSTNKRRYLVIVGIVAAAVLLAILLHTMLGNQPPRIVSLGAQSNSVIPSGSCQITCHATDPDGDDDDLSYDWSATAGEITGEGATVNWTAPDSGGSYKVTVTVTDPRGGEAMGQVTITVGAPPVITSLVADRDWITPSGSLQVTCTASDPDGDELSYEWTATGGSITATGSQVIWTAPEEVGVYNITVVITDGHGSSDTASITLIASNGPPPVIEGLIVTAKEPKYLKETSAGYTVGRTKQYDIECKVSDTSGEVSYEWSCEDGAISGEGSIITWTAPDEALEGTTVTVIVSDVAGNRISESIVFKVASCNSCTFG